MTLPLEDELVALEEELELARRAARSSDHAGRDRIANPLLHAATNRQRWARVRELTEAREELLRQIEAEA